ncbi:MAG: hypothetical protein IJ489_08675 [Clostridia bacterium]|nr:hypothetical protein [Clostridia bacterium]
MKRFYYDSLHIYETSLRSEMRNLIRDPNDPYYARFLYETGLPEPGCVFGLVERAVLLYLCPDSIYYQKSEVLEYIRLICISGEEGIHEDGTNDLLVSNYRQPEYFGIPGICNAYRMMNAIPQKTEEEAKLTEMIYHLMERISGGLLASGFHTPNHRWVHTAALYWMYNTLREKDERFLSLARKYLAEKIDIDENGEFSERSAGMYSAVSDRALCDIAIEADMPELFALVKRNLRLVYRFIEKGSLIFTQNSRRKDKGEVGSDTLFDFDRYTDICLTAYANTHDAEFLQILKSAMDKRIGNEPIYSPFRIYMRYPELKDLCVDFSVLLPIEEEFHMFLPKSGIVRAKEKGIVYSILARNPDFLHITVGSISISARICSSFFAKAQFLPDEIEQIGEKSYRMTFHTWADYKLPFDNPPAGSENYWTMDYKSRQSISRCDYGYTVDFIFTENGLKLHMQTHDTEKVPFKLEIAVTPGVHVRAGTAMTIGNAGEFLCATDGDVAFSNFEGDSLTVCDVFAKHFYHKNMRGSLPSPQNKYLLYLTDFAPVDRTVSFVCEKDRPFDYFTKNNPF